MNSEAGDGTVPVPQSIADGEAWNEHIGRRQMALGAWIAATEAALAQQPEAPSAPEGMDEVRIPRALADRVMTALGKFISDEGWSVVDMETADDFSALAGQQQEGDR